MTEQELVEALAEKEHASWARWMEYLFSKCLADTVMTSAALIPAPYVQHWLEEIKTAYADLPEQTKQSDRDEVAHILPIIREYAATNATQEIVLQIDGKELARAVLNKAPGVIRQATGVRSF